MTNVMKGADLKVDIFPRKSYRENKSKSSGFYFVFKKCTGLIM
jgi:hypothetical protein